MSRRRKKNKKPKPNTWRQERDPNFRSFVDREKDLVNPNFEKFYRAHGIVPDGEWDMFMESLRTPLHISFRVNGSRKAASLVREMIPSFFGSDQLEVNGKLIDPPRSVGWYPSEHEDCWVFSVGKKDFKKNPALAKFKEFLVAGGESGLLVRQELVSMIPPCLLDVHPNHLVLDMCAAPGSKTTQLVETLDRGTGQFASGMVVANDVNAERAYTIHHRLKSFSTANLLIVAHDARAMPALMADAGADYQGGSEIRFDRVLADVPCSGDGTMRKAVDMWKRWRPNSGAGIHQLQLDVARRGLAQLKAGGRMVYSTCSLNPHENEAVVAALLRENPGTLRLVDVSDLLPGLVRVPGITTWSFMDASGEWIADPENDPKIVKTLLPPSEEEVANMHLERTFRILPHHQDTGGFYLAVLESVTQVAKLPDTPDTTAPLPPKTKKPRKQPKNWEEPFYPLTEELKARISKALEFYGIEGLDVNRLMRRSETAKIIYYMGGAVHSVLPRGPVGGIVCVGAGIRVFKLHKKHEDCPYRIESDGCRLLAPMMTKQIVVIDRDDLVKLLGGAALGKLVLLENLSEQAQVGARQAKLGSVVLQYPECGVFLPGWRGANSISHQVPKIPLKFYQILFNLETK